MVFSDSFLAADILSLVELHMENLPFGDPQNFQVIVLHLFVVSMCNLFAMIIQTPMALSAPSSCPAPAQADEFPDVPWMN